MEKITALLVIGLLFYYLISTIKKDLKYWKQELEREKNEKKED